MFPAIEKMPILKSVPIVSSVPEGQLVDLATIVKSSEFETSEFETSEFETSENIMNQSDWGTSIYNVVDGRVRLFEGDKNLSEHGTRSIAHVLCDHTRQNLTRAKS